MMASLQARQSTILTLGITVMILFSAFVPVYASHIEKKQPTADEKRLFEKIVARLEEHSDMMPVPVEDAKKSLSGPVRIFFPCNNFDNDAVESVSIDVETQFIRFDQRLAETHKTTILSGMYVWDCTALKNRFTMTIECVNSLMLNPEFMTREENEPEQRRDIASAENEMVLYHELLHAQLMLDAMMDITDASGWRKEACNFFGKHNNDLDYGPSDRDHTTISKLETEYLEKVIADKGSILLLKSIDKNAADDTEFTQVVARFDELGPIAQRGFFLFARAINLENVDLIVSTEEETISVSGSLQDPTRDGLVRLFVVPMKTTSDVLLALTVDEQIKSSGSQFAFDVKIINGQTTDTTGTIFLRVDGSNVAHQGVNLYAGGEGKIKFIWKSPNDAPSKYIVTASGFNQESSEVIVYSFDGSKTGIFESGGVITDQIFIDQNTKEEVTVAKPNKISGIAIVTDSENAIELLSPDGTIVIGKSGLVSNVDSSTKIVKVNDVTLALKYTELNERLRFFAVKPALRDSPLSSGDWSIKVVDSNGLVEDTKIKLYVSYMPVSQAVIVD